MGFRFNTISVLLVILEISGVSLTSYAPWLPQKGACQCIHMIKCPQNPQGLFDMLMGS